MAPHHHLHRSETTHNTQDFKHSHVFYTIFKFYLFLRTHLVWKALFHTSESESCHLWQESQAIRVYDCESEVPQSVGGLISG
jgi:hypothetical protein